MSSFSVILIYILTAMYCLVNIIAALIGAIIGTDTCGTIDYRVIWIWQTSAADHFFDELNPVGRVLLIIFVTFLTLPCSVVFAGFIAFGWICKMFWRGFLYVFRRRNEDASESEDGTVGTGR